MRKLVRPEGFEPPTPWFEAKYSIQLSYGRILSVIHYYSKSPGHQAKSTYWARC